LELAIRIISKLFGKEILDLLPHIVDQLISKQINPLLFNKTVNGISHVLNNEVEFIVDIQQEFENGFTETDAYGCQAINL